MHTPVELPYISCKNLGEVVHIRHYLQESCKNLGFQTNLSDSCRSDISCRFRRSLQDSCRSRLFLQDSWTDLPRQCLKLERYSARKCLECTENVEIVFSIVKINYVSYLPINYNVTKVIEIRYVYFRTLGFGSCIFATIVT